MHISAKPPIFSQSLFYQTGDFLGKIVLTLFNAFALLKAGKIDDTDVAAELFPGLFGQTAESTSCRP